eukprot:TRINITY_DN6645_c0_g1_i1.p1 TRINITY_DN6645_c0_g1~~TRINITY_DN6645_c0_g1_i1.p1  ORF type:complete len:395 (+),score=91.27 TRINITY_DN6645_c0_g1_i1:42-1226(+)
MGDDAFIIFDTNTWTKVHELGFKSSTSVDCIVFSPDNSLIYTSESEFLRVWDAESGKELSIFEGHSDGIYALTLSPDGTRVISGSDDKTVKVWEATPGPSTPKEHGGEIEKIGYSPDGKFLVSADSDRYRVTDANTGAVLSEQEVEGYISAILISPDNTLYMAQSDSLISYALPSLKEVNSFEVEDTGDRLTIDFHHGYACAPKTHGFQKMDIKTGKVLAQFALSEFSIDSVAWSRDGQFAYSGSVGGTLKKHNAKDLTELHRTKAARMDSFTIIKLMDNDTLLLVMTEDGFVSTFDTATMERKSHHSVAAESMDSLSMDRACLTPDDKYIITCSRWDNYFCIHDWRAGSNVLKYKPEVPFCSVTSRYTADNKLQVACGTTGGRVERFLVHLEQ